MRVTGLGRVAFAMALAATGISGVASRYGAFWRPAPAQTPAHAALALVYALVCLASGLGLVWRRTAAWAARLLLALLLAWVLLFRAPVVWRAPFVVVSWEACAETVVLLAAAWALWATLAGAWERRRLGPVTGEAGLRVARALYGLSMIVFGAAHFAYLKYTASLVPRWIPSHEAWVRVTGAAYIVAGAAVLTGVLARMAVRLSALQMGLFTLLVWGPVLAAGSAKASDWNETVVSAALTAAGWVVADSWRRRV